MADKRAADRTNHESGDSDQSHIFPDYLTKKGWRFLEGTDGMLRGIHEKSGLPTISHGDYDPIFEQAHNIQVLLDDLRQHGWTLRYQPRASLPFHAQHRDGTLCGPFSDLLALSQR